MKADIHPKYNNSVTVKCACGARFTVGSTKDDIKVEICSQCHPFYTGSQKIIDTAGRVEKFRVRAAKASVKKGTKAKPAKHSKK